MISAKALGAMPQFVLEAAGERRLLRAFDSADLPVHFIEERGGYISEHALATFVHEAARSTGQQNIGLLWSPYLTVADYGAWGSYVLSAPTLGAALIRASAVMPFHSSTDRAWLETSGTSARYCYRFGLRSHFAYPDIGFSAVGVFLSIFRAYLGNDWKPSAVLLDFPKVPGFVEAEDTYACPVIWNATRLGVEFEASALSSEAAPKKLSGGSTTVGDISRERLGGPPQTLRGQVEEVVWQQLHREEMSIDATARSLDLGVRTLQRKLASEGVRFREIVNDIRVARAEELLTDTRETVSSISSMLGYETANNFSRAFKKVTGLAPSDYRQRNSGHT
ncbi:MULTISPECIES: AraC family transcriptional regulator [Ruegeria]|nr:MULTISPECIES: AraC family transcriptional regulator [Ruegeria]NOD35616.1 helix-turn-helix domain-containing protein [Ruegeria sp. HKCCD7296]NOE42982.1 helix-turn-helix domain-containing protein [Ruegeria sp. HKCCD7319]